MQELAHARSEMCEVFGSGSPYISEFQIGGVAVRISGDSETDVVLSHSLRVFESQTHGCDIEIRVEWVGSLAITSAPLVFESGSVWRLYEDEEAFQFDFQSSITGERPYKRLIVDKQFRRATLLMNSGSFADSNLAVAPLEYPLDELLMMHRLTQENAIELHSCGIVNPNGVGNLFVGHSGAGKSTTTRLWTGCEDVEILSDDRIIVRRGSAQGSRHMQMYGTPWHGEAAYASPGSAPLARIFVLEHGHGNVLTRLSPSQAVAELFARSFVPFHRHEYVDSALRVLQDLVSEVPCYRYAFEPNEAAVERIREFCD
jgi:hypothetical protein